MNIIYVFLNRQSLLVHRDVFLFIMQIFLNFRQNNTTFISDTLVLLIFLTHEA